MSPEEQVAPEEHVAPEDIARLAEGGVPPDQAEPMLAHFSQCRSCMAAYTEAVRYRAAWLAKREAFEPPGNVLARARDAVRPAPANRNRWPRQLWRLAPVAAAVALMVVLVVRLGRPPETAPESLPPAVAQELAAHRDQTRGLFVPGAETVRGTTTRVFRGETDHGTPIGLVDSLQGVFESAPAGSAHVRSGFRYASALLADGHREAALDVVTDLVKLAPRDCACRSLAAALEYPRSREGAQEHLRTALEAGCRDDVTRINLAIVQQALRDSADAHRTFRELANRKGALGDRAREELGLGAATH
jgi:hypothetical protein